MNPEGQVEKICGECSFFDLHRYSYAIDASPEPVGTREITTAEGQVIKLTLGLCRAPGGLVLQIRHSSQACDHPLFTSQSQKTINEKR